MQTQQVGTDISADVSWTILNRFLTPTYQFKGVIASPSPGVYTVTINRGEGIDLAHAEVVVHCNSASFLNWKVEELAPTLAGERVFQVTFSLVTASIILGVVDHITFVPTDPISGSITIRRKVPSVN